MKEPMKFFEEETAWGKSAKRANEDVKSALENKILKATQSMQPGKVSATRPLCR